MQNWKTTVAGILVAVGYALQNYAGANTWQGYATALAIAVLGAVAKDFDVHSTATQVAVSTKQADAAIVNAINK